MMPHKTCTIKVFSALERILWNSAKCGVFSVSTSILPQLTPRVFYDIINNKIDKMIERSVGYSEISN